MARRPVSGFLLVAVVAVLLSLLFVCFHRFPVLGGAQVGRGHRLGEEVYAVVGSLTSPSTLLPLGYYTLPYCRPPGGIEPAAADNLWEALVRPGKHNSPYRFRVGVNQSLYLCTTEPLTAAEVEAWRGRMDDYYAVNMFVDGLPVTRRIEWGGRLLGRQAGFPVGYAPGLLNAQHSIVNHLRFRVRLHETRRRRRRGEGGGAGGEEISDYRVVGVEMTGCGLRWPAGSLPENHHMFDRIPHVDCPPETSAGRPVLEGDRVEFTYEVEFMMSNISRWTGWDDGGDPFGSSLHWSSALNSLISIVLLTAFLFFRCLRRMESVFADHARAAQLVSESHLSLLIPGGLRRQKLVAGDIFGRPRCAKLLCALVGSGAQIACVAIVLTSSAALGLIYMPSQSLLLTWVLILYLIFGLVAGYVGVWCSTNIRGDSEGWRSVCWWIACFFSGIVFLILSVLNFIYWQQASAGSAPMASFLKLLGLWCGSLVPLTYLGGMLSAKSELTQFPLTPSRMNRGVAKQSYWPWVSVLVCGFLSFSTLVVEHSYVLNSLWHGMPCDAYGFLVVAIILLVVVCAEVSVIVVCKNLQTDDWNWWWKAFLAPGSSGLFMFLYELYYLITRVGGLSSSTSVILYLGYSVIAALAMALSTGAIGALADLCFVHFIFSRKNFQVGLRSNLRIEV